MPDTTPGDGGTLRRAAPVIPHNSSYVFCAFGVPEGRPLARAQDRLLGPCFKTGPGGTSILSLPIDSPPAHCGKADGVRWNPSRARLQTPRAVSPSSRHRPSELSVATVGQATGTKGQLSGDLASCDAEAVS